MTENILVVAPEYFSFVKDQTESIAKYFSKINVLVRHNPFAEISTILPINSLRNFQKGNLINCKNLPPNISIIPTPVYYAPLDFFYKRLGMQHFSAANGAIKKKKLNFDIIHAHATWSSGYVGARLKEQYHVPLVVTAHGYDIYSLPFKDAIWKKNIEYVLNTADAVITVSQSNLAYIRRLDVDTPVHVIPNGFRSDLFSPKDTINCRRLLGLPLDRKIVLTVGNLEPVKGQQYLVGAVNEVIKGRKDILCIIVGMGSEKHALENQIRSLGLEDHIMLVGAKRHDEIPLWMNACDLFVLPSLRESFGVVQIEALACGKPVIATRNGGSEEVIISEEYGLLIDAADYEDLAEKILIALDREWNREMIITYAKRFTGEKISKEILGVYEQIFQDPK